MPVIQLRKVADPEAVALAVIALRSYSEGVQPTSDFETSVLAELADLKLDPKVASRVVARFDKLKNSYRSDRFGPLALQTTLPKDYQVARRNPDVRGGGVVLARASRSTRETARVLPGSLGRGGPIVSPPHDRVAPKTRYTVTYEGMHCIDETWADWAGSDSTYVITTAVHISPSGRNVVRTERHPITNGKSGIYENVDSGDTRVGPRAACWGAEADDFVAGVSITTTFMEHDSGDPDRYKDEIEGLVKAAIAVTKYFYPLVAEILALLESGGLITDLINELLGSGDDEIGSATTVIETQDLDDYSRTPPSDYRVGHTRTGLKYHFLSKVNDNDYAAGFRIARSPALPVFEPIVE